MNKRILLIITIATTIFASIALVAARNFYKIGSNEMEDLQEDEKQLIELNVEQLRQKGTIDKDEEIVDVIFGESEITIKEAKIMRLKELKDEKETEKIKIKYPQVVTIRDENIKYQTLIKLVKFLDKKGDIKKTLLINRYLPDKQFPSTVEITKNNKFISVTNIIQEERGEVKKAETSIFNLDGNLIHRIEHPYQYPYISPDGKYLIGSNSEPIDASIGVYNQNGLVKKVEKDFPLWNIDFSKDGSYFAVTLGIKIEGKNGYRADLIVMDENGNELWKRKSLTTGIASYDCPINISDDDIITVITGVSEYKIYRFDIEGNLISEEQGNMESLEQFKNKSK